MTAERMPGLAQLMELHKKKSHILRTVLEPNIGTGEVVRQPGETCAVLEDAIGQLRPSQLQHQCIPGAIAELHEIGAMIETCVEVIMEKAEKLMELEPAFDDAMLIMESCSFQDIAGQRLSKVTKLLENLEERLGSLVDETGVDDKIDAMGEEELETERRRKELILHGPQLTGDGVSQDEIDALLGA